MVDRRSVTASKSHLSVNNNRGVREPSFTFFALVVAGRAEGAGATELTANVAAFFAFAIAVRAKGASAAEGTVG